MDEFEQELEEQQRKFYNNFALLARPSLLRTFFWRALAERTVMY